MSERTIENVACVAEVLRQFNGRTPVPEGFRLAGGAATLRLAQIHDMILLRDLGARPSSYNTCGVKLLDSVVRSRLLELSRASHAYNFQFFEVAYFTDWPSFMELTQDLGFELEQEEWAQHKENVAHRFLLFKALWERQWEGLTEDVESLPPPDTGRAGGHSRPTITPWRVGFGTIV